MVERGTITRVQGRKVFVEVPALGLGVEFGPCDVAWQSDATELAAVGDTQHRHDLPGLQVGMKVVVGLVHNVPDDVVVLGIIG